MLEFNLWHFQKMPEIHCIKNARNEKSTIDLRWTIVTQRWIMCSLSIGDYSFLDDYLLNMNYKAKYISFLNIIVRKHYIWKFLSVIIYDK